MKDNATEALTIDELRSRLRSCTQYEREDVLIEIFRELVLASMPLPEPQKANQNPPPKKKDRKPRYGKPVLTVIGGGRRFGLQKEIKSHALSEQDQKDVAKSSDGKPHKNPETD